MISAPSCVGSMRLDSSTRSPTWPEGWASALPRRSGWRSCLAAGWSPGGDRRALLLGLPLLHVLTISELRAVLAHELAHLARGDATWSAGSLRFVEGLGRALDDRVGPVLGTAPTLGSGLPERGRDAHRADRQGAGGPGGSRFGVAGRRAGGGLGARSRSRSSSRFSASSSSHRDGEQADVRNLYASFRAFWARLPDSLLEAIRLRLLTVNPGAGDSPHPPLPDRVAMVQSYPDRPRTPRRTTSLPWH